VLAIDSDDAPSTIPAHGCSGSMLQQQDGSRCRVTTFEDGLQQRTDLGGSEMRSKAECNASRVSATEKPQISAENV